MGVRNELPSLLRVMAEKVRVTDRIQLVPYSRAYLDRSWDWLQDPEVKHLTVTPDFDRAGQLRFFEALPDREDYLIWGLELEGTGPIGAAGLKHIRDDAAEYWGYIGEKTFWGRGLGSQILEEIEKKARDLKLTKLDLKVARYNARAIRLYKKHGYSECGGDDVEVHMAKTLTR